MRTEVDAQRAGFLFSQAPHEPDDVVRTAAEAAGELTDTVIANTRCPLVRPETVCTIVTKTSDDQKRGHIVCACAEIQTVQDGDRRISPRLLKLLGLVESATAISTSNLGQK